MLLLGLDAEFRFSRFFILVTSPPSSFSPESGLTPPAVIEWPGMAWDNGAGGRVKSGLGGWLNGSKTR